jgi:hypothetical protein
MQNFLTNQVTTSFLYLWVRPLYPGNRNGYWRFLSSLSAPTESQISQLTVAVGRKGGRELPMA